MHIPKPQRPPWSQELWVGPSALGFGQLLDNCSPKKQAEKKEGFGTAIAEKHYASQRHLGAQVLGHWVSYYKLPDQLDVVHFQETDMLASSQEK